MVSRAVTLTLGAVSAAFGFAFAFFVPRPAAPARVVTRVVSAPATPPQPCPLASPTPCAPSTSRAAPSTSSAAPSTSRAAPLLVPPAPRAAPTERRASPLKAFRFVGLGPAGGLRLGRVAAGSLPEALGLRTGDELISVNDFKLADPEQALNAYARLRTAERLRLAVSRGGARSELVYFIR